MTLLDVVIAVATVVGCMSSAVTLVIHLRQRPQNHSVRHSVPAGHGRGIDPVLADHINRASADWAARCGQPQAAPLAAGYLVDIVDFVQRRSS